MDGTTGSKCFWGSRGRVLQQRGYTQEGHSCDHAIEYGRGIVEQRSREAAIKRSASC